MSFKMNKKSAVGILVLIAIIVIGLLYWKSTTSKTEMADVTDYSNMENWAIYAEGKGEADLFFICPTVDLGADGHKNMSLEDEETKSYFLGASNMELGIYDDNAVVYVPYYRQVTFAAYEMDEKEAEPYFDEAYADVKASFDYYLENADPERPLILAGFSQGSQILIHLMKDYFDDEELSERLVAAYAIGWRLTKEETEQYDYLIPAQEADDTGVIVAFNSEAEGVTGSLMVPEGTWTYSINPLNWETDSTPAYADENDGACFTNYDGEIVQEIDQLTGAYIDSERGTLICTDIVAADYSNALFEDGIYHLYDYQFFYKNLEENVETRLNAWKEKNNQ